MRKRLANIKTRNQAAFDYVVNGLNVISPFGKEAVKNIRTFFPGEEEDLIKELNKVEELKESLSEKAEDQIKIILMEVKDISFSIKRAKEDPLSVVELFEIKSMLLAFEKLEGIIEKNNLPKLYWLENTKELLNTLDPRGDRINTFYIYEEFSEKLKELREEKRSLEISLRGELKSIKEKVKSEYGIHLSPKFDYKVSKQNHEEINTLDQIGEMEIIDQDYMCATYGVKLNHQCQNIKVKEEELVLKIQEEEDFVREKLSKEVGKYEEPLLKNCGKIGELDFNISKADYYNSRDMVKPEILKEHVIQIEKGRHLQVEEVLNKKGKEYMPVSLELSEGVTCITGANMGGKTISLKLIGQVALLAQMGFYVPCHKAKVGLSYFIQILIGDSQSVERGLSSFGSEMEELKEILDNSKERSLILVDEIASGTNPAEGKALTKSIMAFLETKPYISVITTHYEGANKKGKVLQVKGLGNVDLTLLDREIKYANRKERIEIIGKYMDYTLAEVKGNEKIPMDALNIARILGIDKKIIEEAKKYLEE